MNYVKWIVQTRSSYEYGNVYLKIKAIRRPLKVWILIHLPWIINPCKNTKYTKYLYSKLLNMCYKLWTAICTATCEHWTEPVRHYSSLAVQSTESEEELLPSIYVYTVYLPKQFMLLRSNNTQQRHNNTQKQFLLFAICLLHHCITLRTNIWYRAGNEIDMPWPIAYSTQGNFFSRHEDAENNYFFFL